MINLLDVWSVFVYTAVLKEVLLMSTGAELIISLHVSYLQPETRRPLPLQRPLRLQSDERRWRSWSSCRVKDFTLWISVLLLFPAGGRHESCWKTSWRQKRAGTTWKRWNREASWVIADAAHRERVDGAKRSHRSAEKPGPAWSPESKPETTQAPRHNATGELLLLLRG